MKSPLKKSIGEVVTDYGAKVMKVFKEGLLGRSLFDFYGDVKALTFRTKEVTTVPTTPPDGKGGVIYTKNADGKLYYKSNEISEVELSSQGTNTTYSVSCVDGDNSDEEKIRLTGSDSSTDDVVLEAGTGLSIARDSDKITFTNTVTDTNTQNTTTLSFVDSSNDIILRNTTGGAGSGTDDIKFVAGSNITLTHTDADNITIASTDTNTQLSTEEVQDIAGALVATGGTKTGITVTYDDDNNNMDFVVDDLHNVGVDGSANNLLTDDGDGTVTSESNLTYDGENLSITSSATSAPDIILIATANAAAPSNLIFKKERSSSTAVDIDPIGNISFQSKNDGGADETYAAIYAEIADASAGAEGGRLKFQVASHDGEINNGLILEDGDAEDEVDVTIASGASSVTTVAGNLTAGGKLEVNQAGTGTSNSPSDVAEISGQAAGSVLKALSLVNSVTAASGNGTQLAFHNASNYSPTGTITTTQAGDTTTDSKMEFQIYRGGLQTALTIDHDSDITVNQGSLTVGDINLNNKRIIITGDTDDTFDITSTTHGATTISTTDTAGAQADLSFIIDGGITATSTSFSATTDDFTIASATSSHPTLMIAHTANNAQGGELVFHNKRGAAGVDGDICGLIHFKAPNHDGSDNFIFYASIVGYIEESNDTDEAGRLELYVATSDGSSSAPQKGLVLTGSGSNNDIDVTIGHGATSVTTISGRARSTSAGDFSIPFRIFAVTTNTDGSFDGDVVRFGGTTSMTTGAIYHYNSSGNWELADADDNTKSDGLLGVALGAASDTNGVLLRGMVTLDHDPGAVGDVLYLSTTAGDCSSTAPSSNGNIVRIIGYCLDASNGQIWFNPDNTFVEYTT